MRILWLLPHSYYEPIFKFYTRSFQMRIISGKYKGRNLSGFQIEGTRPTMDRVKESLFAMIQTKVKGSICLDLFAGSGSLGFEALSQGASKCYFVDKNRKVIQTLKQNQEKLQVEEPIVLLHQDFKQALILFHEQKVQFDLIFLDPPYDDYFIQESLQMIEKYDLLKDQGMIICEYETESFTSSYEVLREKKYGDKKIRIYQKK